MIDNMMEGKSLPVYGDGKNVRDWLYVEDHVSAIWLILDNGKTGESYNIGGENEWRNIRLVETLCDTVAASIGKHSDEYRKLITYVTDRKGHDRRYAIDCSKMKSELAWKQSVNFEQGLKKTVDWYISHKEWVDHIKKGTYRDWLETNYEKRR